MVSAGQYLGRLLNEIAEMTAYRGCTFRPIIFAAGFGVVVTVYFWWSNIKGIHESSGKALRIMQITTVMVVAFLIWCPHHAAAARPKFRFRPRRCRTICISARDALGWFKGTVLAADRRSSPIIIAFGHSLLSMSGFETLAQVYREIAYPKLKNLKIHRQHRLHLCRGLHGRDHAVRRHDHSRCGSRPVRRTICWAASPCTWPDRRCCACVFHIFVVIVGVLILSGAVNTSIIGANGVMNRVAEDGVLLDWFRKPHRRFGTTYRIINLIALLQIGTIVLSRGDVYLLGEAYAFGVVWSFFLKSLGVLVLRYQRHDQEYKIPSTSTSAARRFRSA